MARTAYMYNEKNLVQILPLEAVHGLYSLYIYNEKSWSRDFSDSVYMSCRAYIYDEKRWSGNFPYSLYMDCTAYTYNEEIV
jgi:hypothetical protein